MGCTTPTRDECRIPAYPPCPPPGTTEEGIFSATGSRLVLLGGGSLQTAT
ncbi:unnamed protein product [Arabidopsis halleri]